MTDSAQLELLCELVSRASVTPEDAGCQALIAERLAAAGFAIEHIRVGEVDNLWATHGDATGGPTLCLAGHTDVVPTGPERNWISPPFEPTIRDGHVFGRGAADMKSGLACMVTAAESWVASDPEHRGRLAFLITSDEEGPALDGTRAVVQRLIERGEQIDYAVVGECSSVESLGDRIMIGRRGSIGATLTVHGRQGHVAYPHLACNPVHIALPALQQLTAECWDQGNADFPPTSFQITNIHAGTGATNVIPGDCVIEFNLRFSTELDDGIIRERVAAILDAHELSYELSWWLSGKPFLTAPGALRKAAHTAINRVLDRVPDQSTAGGTSDGRFIATMGAEVVEIGPINATIHQTNECVAIDALPKLHSIYVGVIDELLGQ